MEKHGDHVSESNRGQIAVTHKDFENIANVISNPDSVIKGKEDNTIEVSKRIGEHIYVVQEIRTRRKKLAVITMWKKPLSAHDAPQNESSAETPKTYGKQASPSDKSIAQSPENAIAEKITTKGTVVAKNHNAIYQGKGDSYILAKLNGKAKIAFVQVKKGEDGSFYEIKNATPGRDDQFKNKKPVWERNGPIASSDEQTSLIPGAKSSLKSIAQSPENAIPTNLPRK